MKTFQATTMMSHDEFKHTCEKGEEGENFTFESLQSEPKNITTRTTFARKRNETCFVYSVME